MLFRSNLGALRDAGWRLLCSPVQPRPAVGFGYAVDNGAWPIHTAGRAWDDGADLAFRLLVDRIGAGADWVALPDVVMGGRASLELTLRYLGEAWPCPVLIPVQDGVTEAEIRPLLSARVGVFVGGSTDWKELTAARWATLTGEVGAYCHVGRVNSRRRIFLIGAVDSWDGTSATRYSKNVPLLDGARRQVGLWR